MNLNRRGFLGALFGAAVAPALPRPKPVPAERPAEGMSMRVIRSYQPDGSICTRLDVLYGFGIYEMNCSVRA